MKAIRFGVNYRWVGLGQVGNGQDLSLDPLVTGFVMPQANVISGKHSFGQLEPQFSSFMSDNHVNDQNVNKSGKALLLKNNDHLLPRATLADAHLNWANPCLILIQMKQTISV